VVSAVQFRSSKNCFAENHRKPYTPFGCALK